MATTNVIVRHRPVKIGFLVRQGETEDVFKAAGLNTLLWGGIYNPIIPVSQNPEFAERLIKDFLVDVLYQVSPSEDIVALDKKYPFLKSPYHLEEKIFQLNGNTNKNTVRHLDVINIIESLWQKEYKEKRELSKFHIIKWEEDDPLKNLFAVSFGYFPNDCNLEIDYEEIFRQGLNAGEWRLRKNEPIDSSLTKLAAPIEVTRSKLIIDSGPVNQDGIYIGDETNFDDLVTFWNLRSSGVFVEFLSRNHVERCAQFINKYLVLFNKPQGNNSKIENEVCIHYSSCEVENVKEIAKQLDATKKFYLARWDPPRWRGSSLPQGHPNFGSNTVLANVDKEHGRFKISLSLPEKPIPKDSFRNARWQSLIASISPLTEYEYPEHTIEPPFIWGLNEFYSREITFDPWNLRIEKGGISVFQQASDETLSLFPIPHEKLILKILEHCGIKATISQAGLITKRIIEALGDIWSGKILMIKGVRKLLSGIKAEESVTRGNATQTIWDDGDFKKYERVFSAPIENKQLSTPQAFDFLLSKDFFRGGLELSCGHCGLKTWLSLRQIDDIWTCDYCGYKNKTSLHIKDKGDWRFRKSGLFAKENNQEGAIPVILSLSYFLQRSNLSNTFYLPSQSVTYDNKNFEIDYCILRYNSLRAPHAIELGIGECKSQGGSFDEKDIEKVELLFDKFRRTEIECFFIFSRTTDSFSTAEIGLFKSILAKQIPLILLTNKELESFDLLGEFESLRKEGVPYNHPYTLQEMSFNSQHLYLR